jgi:GPH family glycoside/pentoside/hexuronide:cation symporter
MNTNNLSKAPQSLPKKLKVTYALGQFGWSLILGLVNVWLVWFYNPPEGDVGALNILFIPQVRFLGFLTIIGLITMLSRLMDAVTDPWIATLSDRSNHPKGRRISFMRIGAAPFALLTILAFLPPFAPGSYLNALWLGVTLIASYVFYTMYVTPYFALVSELGQSPKERLDLSTYISATWFLGYVTASGASVVWGTFTTMGMEKLTAIRVTIAIFAAIGLFFMLLPVFTIDEKKYSRSNPSTDKVIDSIKATFRNREFRIFVYSDLVYWISVTMFATGTVYYVTVLAGLPDTWTFTVTAAIGVLSFLFYVPVNLIAKKIGKKRLLVFAFFAYSIVFIYTGFLGKLPLASTTQVFILIILTGLPMAILGILPNAMIADIAEYDAINTHVNREAMFFGARTFMSKLGQMIAMLLFNGLITFGKSTTNDVGIRMSAYVAGITCIGGMLILLLYNEHKILQTLKNH